MDQKNSRTLSAKLEKSSIFPPKLKNFLLLALEEGALESDVEEELAEILK